MKRNSTLSTGTAKRPCGLSPVARRLAWLNIAVQLAFPLAVAFTPAMVGAEQHFLPASPRQDELRAQVNKLGTDTQVYTLGNGETPASVAKKFNMTLPQLRRLNEFRTFARGFDHLQRGDELDVPLVTITGDSAGVTVPCTDDSRAQAVAGYASQAGSFFAGNPDGDAASALARGMATGAASGEIQHWLSHFGTARVQLDADKTFL